MKQAQMRCILAVMVIAGLSEGCTAMFASCNNDGDCDRARGEICVVRDGKEGVCTLPIRECNVGETRACPANCGSTEEVCLDSGRWSGCVENATLRCPTGYLLSSLDGRTVVASAEGSRKDWMCVSCNSEDVLSDDDEIAQQCCGTLAEDRAANIFCCDEFGGNVTESQAPNARVCREAHLATVTLNTSNKKTPFCIESGNGFIELGTETEVFVPNYAITPCIEAYKQGETDPVTNAFDLQTRLGQTIGLLKEGKCDTKSKLYSNSREVTSVYMRAGEGLKCQALFSTMANRQLREQGERVECDNLSQCDERDNWENYKRRVRTSLASDEGLTCKGADSALQAIESCKSLLKALDDGSVTMDSLFTSHRRCYQAVSAQSDSLNRFCPKSVSLVSNAQVGLCLDALKARVSEYLIACSIQDLTCQGMASNFDYASTGAYLDALNDAVKVEGARREILDALKKCSTRLAWADSARATRVSECQTGSCDIIESLSGDTAGLYESCGEHGYYVCSEDEKIACSDDLPKFTGNVPDCRSVGDTVDGTVNFGEPISVKIPGVTIEVKPKEEGQDDAGGGEDAGTGTGESGEPAAAPEEVSPEFVIQSFDVMSFVGKDGALNYILAIDYLDGTVNPTVTEGSAENAKTTTFEDMKGGVVIAIIDENGVVQRQTRLVHSLPPRNVWLEGEKAWIKPSVSVDYAMYDARVAVHESAGEDGIMRFIDVFYMADRPEGSVGMTSLENWVGIGSAIDTNNPDQDTNYSNAVRELYVQSLPLDEDWAESASLQPRELTASLDKTAAPLCDLFDIQSHMSKTDTEQLRASCSFSEEGIKIWRNQTVNGRECTQYVRQLCPKTTIDAVVDFEIDRERIGNVSVYRKNEAITLADGSRAKSTATYVESVHWNGNEFVRSVPSVGEYGMWTNLSACYLEEGTLSPLESGMITSFAGQTWAFGKLLTRSFTSSAVPEVPCEGEACGSTPSEPCEGEDCPAQSDACEGEECGEIASDPCPEGGCSSVPDEQPSAAPTADSAMRIALVQLNSGSSLDSCRPSMDDSSQGDDETLVNYLEPIISWSADSAWNLPGEKHDAGAYASGVRILNDRSTGQPCGTWMGVWPADVIEGSTDVNAIIASRADICVADNSRNGYYQTYKTGGVDEKPLSLTKVSGLGFLANSHVRRMSIEPYREDAALLFSYSSNDTQRDNTDTETYETNLGRLVFSGDKSTYAPIYTEQTPTRHFSVLTTNDVLFTIDVQGNVKMRKLVCSK